MVTKQKKEKSELAEMGFGSIRNLNAISETAHASLVKLNKSTGISVEALLRGLIGNIIGDEEKRVAEASKAEGVTK